MSTKVLMFGWEFSPFNSGGLGVACREITESLSEFTDEVTLVLPTVPEGFDVDFATLINANAEIENVNIKGVESPLTPYISSKEYSQKLRKLKEQGKDISLYGQDLFHEVERYAEMAGEIAKQVDFDVIHAHDWLTFGAGIHAKEVSEKPLVTHVHATEFDRGAGHGVNDFVYEREKSGMEEADVVVTVSNRTKDMIHEEYEIPKEKMDVIYNGINAAKCVQQQKELDQLKAEGKQIVLFVGRITMQKAPDKFIEVAKEVSKKRDDCIFVMAGSGDMEEQVIQQAADYGISDKVVFTGYVRGAELSCLYRSADLYLMPSISEPFGLTALEALAHGSPILISKQSGAAEVVDHALKVDFWDTDGMVNKIISVLDHNPLKNTLSKNGHQEVNKFSWNNVAKSCSDLYDKLKNKLK